MAALNSTSPQAKAEEFAVNELFFSTTDSRGRITSGNHVFQRVSGYSHEELMGAAHNIIRHPDMPRTVFKLVWDTIQRGEAIIGYVKNQSKDGNFYWVLAYITPIQGGYLSLRLKPTSGLLEKISPIYAELKQIEAAHTDEKDHGKSGMTTGAQRLGEILQGMGFASYSAFMQAALQTEIKARDLQLSQQKLTMFPAEPFQGKTKPELEAIGSALRTIYAEGLRAYSEVNSLFLHLDEFAEINQTLLSKSQSVNERTGNFHLISFNSAIEAARVGHEGAALEVISAHMGDTASRVGRVVSALKKEITVASGQLHEANFVLAAIRLQIEMLLAFCDSLLHEVADSQQLDLNRIQEVVRMISILKNAFKGTNERMLALLTTFAANLATLDDSIEDLRRTMLTMQVATVSGLVEANRLQNSTFQQVFQEVREAMDGANQQLVDLVTALDRLDILAKQAPEVAAVVAQGCARVESTITNMAL